MGAMFRGLTVAVITATLVQASGARAEPAATVLVEVVATVDDRAIFDSEVRLRIHGSNQKVTVATWKSAVQELIEEALVLGEALRQGITVADSEIDRAVDEILKDNGFTLLQLEQELEKVGYTLATYKRDISKQLARAKLMTRQGNEAASKQLMAQLRKRARVVIRKAVP